MKNKLLLIIAGVATSLAIISGVLLLILGNQKLETIKVNFITSTYEIDNKTSDIKVYTKNDFNSFVSDYTNNNLPEVYITEFLFDGVGMYKAYDLDDYIEKGNDYELDAFAISVFNINSLGNVQLVGDFKGMVAVDTNNKKGAINIILNGVKIDTETKKVPAIYVYNKDITYTDAKVTIKTAENTKNYVEGGKLKKVSLLPSDNLDNYKNKYTSDNQDYYTEYTNYYGVYTSSQIDKILFAKATADNEDLADKDPYYYYKASGAISSDIDLYFEGNGYLSVTSKNKEGIETKGNLTFDGGVGDYYVTAQDDCLNTTTDSKEHTNARNTLTINVNSLYAIVSNDADEGDAIDSNGELYINGGLVVAIAKPGQDAGLDSETGTYINAGTVLATGDMYDQVNSSSKQNFMVLSFGNRPVADDVITLLDSDDKVIFSYKTDRTYSNLIYSSTSLKEATYYLYKNGTITGEEENGLYTNITSYEKGTQLAYNSKGNSQGGPRGNMGGQGQRPDDMTPPEGVNGNNRPEIPNDNNRPNMQENMGERPEMPNGENMNSEIPNQFEMQGETNQTASNKEFVIEGISNLFSGVAIYSE